MLVLDDVRVVQPLEGLHLPNHVPEPRLVVTDRHLLHGIVSQFEIVQNVPAKPNRTPTASTQLLRLHEKTGVIAGVQQTCRHILQVSRCVGLLLRTAVGGHHRLQPHRLGRASEERIGVADNHAISHCLEKVLGGIGIHGGGWRLLVLQTRGVDHLHELLHIEVLQVHVARLVVLGALVLVREHRECLRDLLKLQLRVHIIQVLIGMES
mmetsp:Transcript_5064/g.12483  ORF Transcript_5064/g.12483 Transcript_5064/m.12483 type:complete len:209 (-) Transcript_5064:362-988(-)